MAASRKSTVIICAVACAVVVPIASAAAPLAYTTPQAIAAKIHGSVPQIPTDNQSPPSQITATVCHGLGAAHAGKFNTFRCSVTLTFGKAMVWARTLAGGKFCASSTGLASCPPPPATAGDPRLCTNPPAPPTADPNRCALRSAEAALVRAMQTSFESTSWTVRNLQCKGKNLSYSCTFSSMSAYGVYYTSAITFASGSGGWAATFATSGGGGTGNTCTVQPAPATAAGAASVWSSGPTPTCTNN